ncbi:MAG TPA: hypothetical protein VE732_06200 [Nitrososphaera sp.]|nr:hypothetical protein [Nitrososphaera sp.]
MKRTILRVVVAVFTFILGVSSAYLIWFIYHSSDIPPLIDSHTEITFNTPIEAVTRAPSSGDVRKSIEEEWQKLTARSLNIGGVYYDPTRKAEVSEHSENPLPLLDPYRMLPSIHKDKQGGIEFLLKQIPDKTRTDICRCPLGFLVRGELAVYCLQHILKVNWYELKEEYRINYNELSAKDGIESQNLLGRIIKSKRGAKEMQALWESYYKNHESLIREERDQ